MSRYIYALLFIAFFSYWQPLTAQPLIFNAGSSVQPGQALSLQGSFGATAKLFLAKGTSTTPVSLPVLTQSNGQATVQIPANLGLDLYQVWVEDQGQRSPGVFVNQARGMHLDSPEVPAGGNLRIVGRNLQLTGANARVRFVAPNGSSLDGIVNGGNDAYVLSLKAPTGLQPGTVYSVFVNNGYGGTAGETKLDQTITAINPGADYFRLGVGWAAKLNFYGNVYNVKTDGRLSRKAVGDGQTNDQPAIQAAIERAYADGGGIVYLPAGNYKLDYSNFEGIHMRSRVVVQGAGKDQTFVRFGYNNVATQVGVYLAPDTYQSGLADMALINVDNSGEIMGNMRGIGKEIFVQNIRFEMGQADWVWLANSDKLVIANSDFIQGVDSQTNYHGPFQFNGCTNFVIANNAVTFAVDGLNLNYAHDGILENNRVYRDGAARYSANLVNHVLILNFAENIAVLNNLFKVINGPAQNAGDGETLIAEGGGGDRVDEEAGTVTGAGPTILWDNAKNWGAFRYKPVVIIVSGPGMGQWRTITSRSGNTLFLDRPWGLVPTAGSHYTIVNWGARNWLLKGNTLEGNRRGITLYHNATTDVAIVNNTLTNSGSIDLTPIQHNDGVQRFIPMYNNQIVGNTVADTDRSNGVFIGAHPVQHAQERTFGTLLIGLEVRNNSLTASRPNTPAVVDDAFPEGYLNYLEYHPVNFYNDEHIPALLGSIFENNTAINCDNALYLNSGSYNTVVCNMNLQNGGGVVKDTPFDKVSHASVETGSCTPKSTVVATPTPGTGTGLRGDYFTNRDLSGSVAVSRVDATVDFNWGTQSPAAGVPTDNFSVRWSGQIEAPVTGNYIFSTVSDDGVRLWVNGVQLIDNWSGHGPVTDNGASVALTAGQKYDIRIEYYEGSGGATARLLWVYPGQSQQAVPQLQLYPAAAAGGTTPTAGTGAGLRGDYFTNKTLSGSAALSRVDATVDFSWAGSPGGSVGADNFSVRWSGQIEAPASGNYVFSTISDDGIRLWVNGVQVINDWTDHGSTIDNSPAVALTAGQKYDIRIEYFESSGGATASLYWAYPGQNQQIVPKLQLYPAAAAGGTTPAAGTGTGLRGDYFTNRDLSGSAALSQVDATVDFNWSGSPGSNVGADNFSVRWSGQIEGPVTGNYVFSTISDDGVRLWVNGVQVINDWTDHGPTTDNSASVALTAGQKYDIRLEFYEGSGGATARLLWAYPGQSQQVVPTLRLYPAAASGTTTPAAGTGTGLRGDYFTNRDLSGSAVLSRVDPTVDFNWAGSPGGSVPADNFSVRWSGQIEAPASGNYVFSTISDDGIRLWVNGVQVINDWTDHGSTIDNSPAVALTAGQRYDIRLEFYENASGATASLYWVYPGQSQQVVPKIRLYPAAGSGRVAAEESELTHRLAVYPVPAREKMTLHYVAGTDGEALVQLVNPLGQSVRHLKQPVTVGENSIELPVGDLSRGIYVLSLTQDGQRITRKVILAE